ncbi:PIN domain-containing protein [Nocardiopsis deserti]|uniref:PIN domain-containing protein n=1 Tax=Nocardiopsis deserti TaxID=2605988 RepID=UPI001238E5B2|nr:hypothetical protein [Nocardiopsis deserti]
MLDTSALVDYGTGRIYARALVSAALGSGSLVLAVPAAALVAARGRLSESARAELDQLVRLSPVVVDGLSADVAARAGDLLARARLRPSGDAVAVAHVAFSARVRAWPVVTSDPGPLRALDAALEIDALP